MLNCFFWYAFVWIIILFLYSLNYSYYNKPLNTNLLIFILATIVIALILGFINRKKFKFKEEAKNLGIMPVIIISIGFLLNFIYAKGIPFIQIAILKKANYGDFTGIPLLYVFIVGISYYYGINYFNAFLNLNEKKKQNLICFLIINLFYLLCFSRSLLMFLIIGAFLLYLQKNKGKRESKNKTLKVLIIIIFMFVILYLFGVLGNIRSGLKYNDNSQIERIGLYNDKFPKILPKQFMWTYSYLTTPLANLNYNVIIYKDNKNFNLRGVINELINRTFAKRIFPDLTHDFSENDFGIKLEKEYFNAATGYCIMFQYGGFFALYIQFFTLMFINHIQLFLLNSKKNKSKSNGTYVILLIINALMFFYNTLSTTTMSWWLLINFIALLPKPRIKLRG